MLIPDDVLLKVLFYLKSEKNGVSGYTFLPYADSHISVSCEENLYSLYFVYDTLFFQIHATNYKNSIFLSLLAFP